MKQMVRLFTADLPKMPGVQTDDLGIFLGLVRPHHLVRIVKTAGAFASSVTAHRHGLSRTAYATSRTGHDLDQVIPAIPGLDLFAHPSGVGQTVHHCEMECFSIQSDAGFAQPLLPAHLPEFHI